MKSFRGKDMQTGYDKSSRTKKVNKKSVSAQEDRYTYGNTVRKDYALPYPQEEARPKKERRISRQVKQNRRKAKYMNAGYVVFLSAAAIAVVVICLQYLHLQTEINTRSRNITALQQELAQTKEQNATNYNHVMDMVNLETIRLKAINELGMVPVKDGQIVTYQNPSGETVKQYEEIPKDGILAKSEQVSK